MFIRLRYLEYFTSDIFSRVFYPGYFTQGILPKAFYLGYFTSGYFIIGTLTRVFYLEYLQWLYVPYEYNTLLSTPYYGIIVTQSIKGELGRPLIVKAEGGTECQGFKTNGVVRRLGLAGLSDSPTLVRSLGWPPIVYHYGVLL